MANDEISLASHIKKQLQNLPSGVKFIEIEGWFSIDDPVS
jgi:hypothetical protein